MTKSKIILTGAFAALALSAMTSYAAIKTVEKPAPIACETQVWPNISADCLKTLGGEKAEIKFRIVAAISQAS